MRLYLVALALNPATLVLIYSTFSTRRKYRQFMNEFGKNLEIFFVNDDRTYKRAVLADLLPFAFGPEDLPDK